MLSHALDYARRGWRVFPVAGKVPAIAGGHGCLDATTDEAQIRAWWKEYPEAGIGLACGPESGVWVLDVDSDHGGLVSLERLEQGHPERPATLVARTGGGGLHFYWRWPEGRKVKNHVGLKLPDGAALSGLDTRAARGYVVAPPSLHPNGSRYSWATDADPEEAPAWLLDVVAEPHRGARPYTSPPPRREAGGHPYAARALENACARVSRAPEGQRNGTLTREAFTIGGFVGAGELARGEAREALVGAAQAAGLPHEEAVDAAARALDAGALEPTPVPEDTRPRVVGPVPVHEDDPGPEDPGEVEDVPLEAGVEAQEEWSDELGEHLTDLGNAKRLVRIFGANIHYCPAVPGGWLVWDGALWVPDESGRVTRYAKCLSSVLDEEAREAQGDATEPEDKKAARDPRLGLAESIRKWARKSESANAIRATLDLVRSEHGVHVRKDRLDGDSWLLGCPNGTVDLQTGAMREHRRADLLTRATAVPFDVAAPCPAWDRFLCDVMRGDGDLVDFLQRAVGYSLTGCCREQVFILLHGTGQNGKSTFVSTLRQILGSYGSTLNARAFVARDDAAIPNDIAALDGARFVIASEARENAPLDEALVKAVTGGEPISARFMRAEWFEFRPRFQVWYSSNHLPKIVGTDRGIWRRIRRVPWDWIVPEGQLDPDLGAKLLEEGPGILAWAIRGALLYQRDGLNAPEGVLAATQAYRSEMDMLADFLADCCVVGEGTTGAENGDLFRAFTRWCETNGEHPKSHRWLTRQLKDRGFKQRGGGHAGRAWDGLALNLTGRAYVNPQGGDYRAPGIWEA